ncbi:MAG TPA: CusA/CzcA family heavy metal efflux RND transporter [Xanthobacteraceae bacterium]|jgi:cobalt-zinc-cadmium resistance protein CzcA|nr:CusA/CzcA family heavy metal efflux RND transporter [Xanthobacteraceae bacterium]
MIEHILAFSIRWRVLVLVLGAILIAGGLYSATRLPIDAVPDITSNQVQINTVAPAFAPLEMEQYVTFPIEVAMSSVPRKQEIRSISQFGLSQVTITFDDSVDVYWARQLVLERLREVERELPAGVVPELSPVSTGLGEIYQFTVERDPAVAASADVLPADAAVGREHVQDTLTDLRTILDWYIKPRLRTVPGVIEVNSFGGREKQYEVQADPARLVSYGLSLRQILEALEQNNVNAGGAYLERGGEQQLLRGIGLIQSVKDIEEIVVASHAGTPVYVRDVARVTLGAQVRQGAATRDGNGETVMGMAMLLKGENSRTVTEDVKARLQEIQKSLPPGIVIKPFYDRTELVGKTIRTAATNLVEGGLLVIVVLFLFLLQIRAGLIVSSAIPLSMLVAIIGMNYFGVSANLMSLGAIDFGLIVDGAVIIVENTVRRLAERRHTAGHELPPDERMTIVKQAAVEVLKPALFGMVIIIAAYIPILTLSGIEGKMFRPMAFTVILALCGALVLSLTLIPALCALFLREPKEEREHPVLVKVSAAYARALDRVTHHPLLTVGSAAGLFGVAAVLFLFMGTEFLPELDEGAIAVNHMRLKSVSLTEAVRQAAMVENTLKEFPEVMTTVSRIGRPEIATDPMGPDMADTYAILKPHDEWRPGFDRDDLVRELSERLERLPGVVSSISQPIKFRMMELIEGVGVRSDVGIKIFGDDLNTLLREANEVARVVRSVPGAADVKVQQLTGLPVLEIAVDRRAVARYGINVADVQQVVQTAIAGSEATTVLEGFMRFGLVVRFPPEVRSDAAAIGNLLVSAPNGERVPLRQLARITSREGPAEVSRENAQRRITVEVNVRDRDIGSFVEEARDLVEQQVQLPAGYTMNWGGMYEHLESGRRRLMIVVPITFAIIFLLLFTTFNSLKQAALVFTGIPFAITGGVFALFLRGMYFSMSAGIGFIALFGVAVLNGVVMVSFINQLREAGQPIEAAIREGALTRLRPVLMTALVASLGFVPMALSTSTGAEVQRPLATVVIGGLITSTALTLLVLPTLYRWFERETPEVEL